VPVESMKIMLDKAAGDRYAVGYFESWNLESLLGVVDAAEETRSPVILGFNGDFMSGRAGPCRSGFPGTRRWGWRRPDRRLSPAPCS